MAALNYHAGLAAEEAVAQRYNRLGHAILARRWRGQRGEIDLIISDGAGYRFVEVKKSRTHRSALMRVSHSQAKRIMSTAVEYVARREPNVDRDMSFDIATVNAFGDIEVLENALHL